LRDRSRLKERALQINWLGVGSGFAISKPDNHSGQQRDAESGRAECPSSIVSHHDDGLHSGKRRERTSIERDSQHLIYMRSGVIRELRQSSLNRAACDYSSDMRSVSSVQIR